MEGSGKGPDDEDRHTEIAACRPKALEDGGDALDLLVIGVDLDRHRWGLLCRMLAGSLNAYVSSAARY